jgi:hypothetical protein
MAVSKSEVTKAIKGLKAIDLKTADYSEIKKRVDILVRAGFMVALFPKNHLPIYRGRVVKPESVFHDVSQLSYPPKSENSELTFNRLSSNKFQIFYGAMMPQETRLDQITAMIEVGSIMRADFSADEEFIQLGMWQVTDDFTIALLGLHSTLASANVHAQEMKRNHKNLTDSLNEAGELIEIVAEFMSHEFSKKVEKGNEWEYKISAAYGEALFEAGVKAIQFPSVKAEGRSFNVALHKDLVDNAMQIEVAAITRLRKINKEIIVDWFLQSPTISNGRFRWEEPPSSAVTGEPEMRLIRKIVDQNGGKFINPES